MVSTPSAHAYPPTYGLNTRRPQDAGLPPFCNVVDGFNFNFDPLANPPWCSQSWCYVDADRCNVPVTPASYLPGANISYSYAACSSINEFNEFFRAVADVCAEDGACTVRRADVAAGAGRRLQGLFSFTATRQLNSTSNKSLVAPVVNHRQRRRVPRASPPSLWRSGSVLSRPT